MTTYETAQEGVMVFPGALPDVYKKVLADVIEQSGNSLTDEEAVTIAMYRVGELATERMTQLKEVVA